MEKIKYEIIMIDWGFYNKLLQTNPAISRTIEAILIVYDITNEESFQNIHRKYYPLINNKFSDVAGVIVGYKTDLEAQRKITMGDALTLADWLGYKYVEMSSKDTEDHSSIIKALAHSIRINRLKIEQSYE
ncbi:Ras family protein [Entamoeba histolytica HM-1:IMSS-B]|nr:small GTPase EhRabX3, putative [Entamoeba histolytica KU27]EMH75603.1 Ras family protein [Entamoeba histolytica HM-1:IMSS-B]ENY61971.1 small GTPase EhRabX3, putative [Entamoeba histolytica HM-1:IMSS-A]